MLLPCKAGGVMRLVAAPCLSWSEPPSQSNLPTDPPSKTARLHKKDDTDTRIIFKSCGTACSLRRFQRLTANFLLPVCLRSAHKLRQQQDRDTFYEIYQNVAQCVSQAQRSRGARGTLLQLRIKLHVWEHYSPPTPSFTIHRIHIDLQVQPFSSLPGAQLFLRVMERCAISVHARMSFYDFFFFQKKKTTRSASCEENSSCGSITLLCNSVLNVLCWKDTFGNNLLKLTQKQTVDAK